MQIFYNADSNTPECTGMNAALPVLNSGELVQLTVNVVNSDNTKTDFTDIAKWKLAIDSDRSSLTEPAVELENVIYNAAAGTLTAAINTATEKFKAMVRGKRQTLLFAELYALDAGGHVLRRVAFNLYGKYKIDAAAYDSPHLMFNFALPPGTGNGFSYYPPYFKDQSVVSSGLLLGNQTYIEHTEKGLVLNSVPSGSGKLGYSDTPETAAAVQATGAVNVWYCYPWDDRNPINLIPWTMELCFNTASLPEAGHMLLFSGSAYAGFNIALDHTGFLRIYALVNTAGIASGTVFSQGKIKIIPGKSHTVSCICDKANNKLSFYLDGEFHSSENINADHIHFSNGVWSGGQAGVQFGNWLYSGLTPAKPFRGTLHALRCYRKVLDVKQIEINSYNDRVLYM